MARPLEAEPSDGTTVASGAGGSALDRAAARAFAAAISSLIIATLVVSQSARALDPEGTVAGNSFEAGTIALVDDDLGRSLVDLSDMAPGRPVERCITVSYEGSILPVRVSLAATTTGPLADFLAVDVDAGTGGGFDDCDSFAADERVYSGTVADLATSPPIDVATVRNQNESMTYRFRFEVLDEAGAVGQAAAVDIVWEAVPA